jgi:hypothetical protein
MDFGTQFDKQPADYMSQHELSKQLRGRNLLGHFPPEDQDTLFSIFDDRANREFSSKESEVLAKVYDLDEKRMLIGDLWRKLDHLVHETHEATDGARRKLVRGFLANKHSEVCGAMDRSFSLAHQVGDAICTFRRQRTAKN